MRKYILIQWIAFLLVLTTIGLTAGCGGSNNLMDNVEPDYHSEPDTDSAPVDLSNRNPDVTDFAVRLVKSSMEKGKNTLISPVSVLTALAMTANGADGETLVQMEEVLGMSTKDMNEYIRSYLSQLPEEETYKLNMANSIWFTESNVFEVSEDFLQMNADYYGADILEAPFDNSTLKEINDWVKEETEGMIPQILDRIPEDAIMYLINALAFDARWQEPYEKHQVRGGIFTLEDGTEQEVKFMHSEEHSYLEDDMATGFIRYYDDHAYAFAALLPNEGISVEEYVASLTGEHLHEMLTNPVNTTVFAAMPKFESEYSVEMSEILIGMGMEDAFDSNLAEFPHMGSVTDGLNIVISRVIHKTFISVTENGTRAGAATAVEMRAEGAVDIDEYETVTLDRPFVYMLIDCRNHIPLFIGTEMTVKSE